MPMLAGLSGNAPQASQQAGGGGLMEMLMGKMRNPQFTGAIGQIGGILGGQQPGGGGQMMPPPGAAPMQQQAQGLDPQIIKMVLELMRAGRMDSQGNIMGGGMPGGPMTQNPAGTSPGRYNPMRG